MMRQQNRANMWWVMGGMEWATTCDGASYQLQSCLTRLTRLTRLTLRAHACPPFTGQAPGQPPASLRPSSAGSSPGFTLNPHAGRAPGGVGEGDVFYGILVEFWLTDADEPLPQAGAPPQPGSTLMLQLQTSAAPLRYA